MSNNNVAQTPIEAFNSPQVSLIRREDPAILIGTTMKLLAEMGDYATVGWNGVSVARIAKLLTDSFWMLRFDELVYVLKKGMNGGYGKIYGTIQYVELARWMNEYIDGEREIAEQAYRDNRIKEIVSETVDVDPEKAKEQSEKFSAFVAEVVAKMKTKEAPPVQDNRPAPTREFLDDRQWTFFVSNKDLFPTDKLTELFEAANKSEFTKTAKSIEDEITRRKTAA